MTTKLITFKTNHTILGTIVKEDDTHITLKDIVQVYVQPSKEGPMMGFSPFLDYSEEFKTGIEFSKADVLCTTTAITELMNQYNQVFGAGIQIASSIPKI
jgi:hypothetical protein